MEEIQKVKCPYCGAEIDKNAEQCGVCKEIFVEPHIKNIKMCSIGQFIAFNILTLGLYGYIWLILNYKAFKDISVGRDKDKLKNLFVTTLVSFVVLLVFPMFFHIVTKILFLMISYRILRIIEKYSIKQYNSAVTHSEAGWFFFDILYVVYFLDTYTQRVYNPDLRNHMELRGWLKYTIIFALIVLLLWCLNFIYVTAMLNVSL